MKFNNKNIFLLPLNPRYTEIKDINFEKIEENMKNEVEVANKILSLEDDYEDLLDLLKSLNENGYMQINQKMLIKLSNDKNNYYILEGNRRALCLKIINKEINYKKLNWNNENIIKKISKILKKENPVYINDNLFEDISEYKLSDIWKLIYSKHVGEEYGKRNWSRAKYLKELLNIFEYYLKVEKDQNKDSIGNAVNTAIEKVSSFFHKKKEIIRNDIRNAIWTIKIIEKYENLFQNAKKIDLLPLKISNLEILLSKKIYFNNESKTIKEVLGIKIEEDKINFSFGEKYKEKEKEIIHFIVTKTIFDKKITTREFKDEVLDEFSEVLGFKLNNKKSALKDYTNLKEKINPNKYEKSKIKFYESFIIDKNISYEIIENNYDSVYIKAIKRLINNDMKTLSNLKSFDSDNYPFSNVAMCIRTILDLLILEMITRTWESLDSNKENFTKLLQNCLTESDLKYLIKFCEKNLNKYELHDVNKIIGKWLEFIKKDCKTNCKEFIDKIFDVMLSSKKFSKNFKKLSFKLSKIKNSSMNCLNIKVENIDYIQGKKENNINLLNSLIHKPYIIDLYKNKSWFYNNLSTMLENLKELLVDAKILCRND